MNKIEEKEQKEIIWTQEQEKIIGTMISESEGIGWTQGWDDANKELIKEVETFLFNLKLKIYRIYRDDEK